MYQKMVDYFEAAIAGGHLTPGSRLPPLRELCRQFSLSMGTVQRGIAILEARGLVEGKQGSGVYVRASTREKPVGSAQIDVIIESANIEVSYCAHALRGVQEVAEENNCSLTTHFTRSGNLPEVQEVALRADLLLILGGFDDRIETLRPGLPAVGLEIHRDYDGQMSPVSIDPVRCAELAVRFFRARGVSRVRLLTQNIPCHRFRLDMFEMLWRQDGGVSERFIEAFIGSQELPDFRPDEGILFTSGTYAERLARQYHALTGRQLRDDYVLLSFDGKALLLPDYLPVSTISTDWVEAGRVVMYECLRRLRFPSSPARRIYLGVYPSYL